MLTFLRCRAQKYAGSVCFWRREENISRGGPHSQGRPFMEDNIVFLSPERDLNTEHGGLSWKDPAAQL